MAEQQQKKEVAKKQQPSIIDRLKAMMNTESVQQQFRNALAENSGPFIASVIDLVSSEKDLRECDPNLIIVECLKAATLKLPINKSLGFAYIVPFAKVPTFIPGYRGYIQLAMRTGQYRHINADAVPQGIRVSKDLLTGNVVFSGNATSDKPQGYFAYFELLNGFSKTLYMTKDEVIAHAKQHSKSYKNPKSAWHTDQDAMCKKTPLRLLLSKYGYLSVEMAQALDHDADDDASLDAEIEANANKTVIDADYNVVDEETGVIDDGAQPEQAPEQPSEGAAGDPAAPPTPPPAEREPGKEEEPLPPTGTEGAGPGY